MAKRINVFYFCVLVELFYFGTVAGQLQISYENGTIVTEDEKILEANDDLTLICSGDSNPKWVTPKVKDEELGTTISITPKAGDQLGTKLEIKGITFGYTGFYSCKGSNGSILSIYLYVHDEDNLAVDSEPFLHITGELKSDIIIPCRPTSPDVVVKLFMYSEGDVTASFDPKIGFTYHVDSLEDTATYTCKYNDTDEQSILITIESSSSILEVPEIEEINEAHNELGNTLKLICITTHLNSELKWITPSTFDPNRMAINSETIGERIKSTLIITPTVLVDNGTYLCEVINKNGDKNNNSVDVKLYAKNEHFLYVMEENGYTCISVNATSRDPVKWNILVRGHPHPSVEWLNNHNETINSNFGKYVTNTTTKYAYLEIKDISLSDYGNYTITATNNYETKSLSLLLDVQDKPKVTLHLNEYNLINSDVLVKCEVISNPSPIITWKFKECSTCDYQIINETRRIVKQIKYISVVRLASAVEGFVECTATNFLGSTTDSETFQVTDVKNGFDIFDFDEGMNYYDTNNKAEVAINETLSMTCGYSINMKSDADWYLNNHLIQNDDRIMVQNTLTKLSSKKKLTIINVTTNDRGTYLCKTKDGLKLKQIQVDVLKPTSPQFASTKEEKIEIISPQSLTLTCNVFGIPKPSVTWYKDSQLFRPYEERIIMDESGRYIHFSSTELKDEATYTCQARNNVGSSSKNIEISIKNKPGNNTILYIIIAVIIVILLILSVLLFIHIKREKKLQKELKLAGLANFEEGATEQINPDLGIDEQADLLPYDKNWEFPINDLKLGKQLGAGAFGVVLKAEAKNIVPGEDVTTVAVKKVKKNADHLYIKALASELKIMVHLGQHINVVNLLGACTKNVAKKELMVIVEYCKFGNLQNYLLRSRNRFINQIDPNTGQFDCTIGQDLLNRTYSISNYRALPSPQLNYADLSFNSSINSSSPQNSKADYRDNCSDYGGNQTGVTEITNISVNSAGYVDRKFSRLNSEQPHWRSNYKGEYKDIGHPVCTQFLIIWSFQIARGMEYLASRKVLHGDLAARNVLLTENNIVKICDFGLAKSVYRNENYKKKSDGPLPIKWMAIESIRDKIFSTQSDVWSFGITLWELFSLSKTPYPGMEADERLYYKLLNGYRMESPEYAPEEIYRIMLNCWGGRAIERPTFTSLAEQLGKFLEDTTKEHYVSLNDPYMQMNNSRLKSGQSDYLAMMNSPDVNNLCSPSYFNQAEGTDGYLVPTNIFSPRTQNADVFNFNVNSKNLAEETRIELQPMLHTVNESDGETPLQSPNSIANPSYHIPPRINRLDNQDNKEERPYVNSGILV